MMLTVLQKGDKLVNPKPGTVCDEVITRRDMYDFYLVPQNVREGSVSPVHFIVVHQPQKPRLSVDDLQSLAYKLTHLYYNWTGTIRVPAPCMVSSGSVWVSYGAATICVQHIELCLVFEIRRVAATAKAFLCVKSGTSFEYRYGLFQPNSRKKLASKFVLPSSEQRRVRLMAFLAACLWQEGAILNMQELPLPTIQTLVFLTHFATEYPTWVQLLHKLPWLYACS